MKRSIKLTIALWLCLSVGTNLGLGTAIAQGQTAPETSEASADSLYAQNKFQEALDIYQKELGELKTPTCDASLARTVELTLDSADCLCRLHKYEAAEECIQKTLAKNGLPTAQKVRLNCAQAGLYYRQGKLAESKRLLDECLKMRSGSLSKPTAADVLLHIYLGELL
jgi:tetratricopeptide (TPR) repeat protein